MNKKKAYKLGAAAVGIVVMAFMVWYWMVYSRETTPLTSEQVRAEIQSLADVSLEMTWDPVLKVKEPARLLGINIPLSGEEVEVPIKGSVRAGFSEILLARAGIHQYGSRYEFDLPAPGIIDIRVTLGTLIGGIQIQPVGNIGEFRTMAETHLRDQALEFGLLEQVCELARHQVGERFRRFGYKTRVNCHPPET